MVKSPNTIWRDHSTDGVPSSGPHDPVKRDIRELISYIAAATGVVVSGPGLLFSTRSSLYADLAHAASSLAWVMGDTTVAYNGVYKKSGASGSGSWARVWDLPYQVIPLDCSGTANFIVATSALPIPSGNLQCIAPFVAPFTNTGAVTIAINGATAVALKSSTGDALDPGDIVAGSPYFAVPYDGDYRLTVESDFASAVATAEAAADAAEVAAGRAEAAAALVDAASASGAEASRLGIMRGVAALKQETGPILLVATGQSNMIGSNVDETGAVSTSANVKIWNSDTDSWQTSVPGVPAGPYTYNTTSPTYPKPNNIAHQLAMRLYEETGRSVYIVLDARGSTPIIEWTASWSVRAMWSILDGKVTAALASTELAGKSKADMVLWHQGEADSATSASTYRTRFNDVYALFKAAAWWDQERPFICGELARGTAHAAQNALHSFHYRYGNDSILTASSAGLAVDSSGVHFTGAALQEMGYTRYANALFQWLANRPTLNTGDVYKTYGNFFNESDLDDRPVAARSLVDLLCTTPDGLRSSTSPYTILEGKLGYRTLIGPALTSGATVPTDMPGGMFLLGGNTSLPSVVALGYTVTLVNTSGGRVTISPPAGGVISTEAGAVSLITLGETGRVTLVAYAADGSSWAIAADGRNPAFQVNIFDDAVSTVTPPNKAGHLTIAVNPDANSPDIQMCGSIAYDVGTTPNCIKMFGGTKLSAVVGDVSGTTGTDGYINVGVVAGYVKIENRSGGTTTLRLRWM